MMTAAVIVRDIQRSPSSPACGEYTAQEDLPVDMDWMKTLSPKRRSCINLSNVEPCVNKVVEHLRCLKTQVDDCNRQFVAESKLDALQQQQPTPVSRSASPKSILVTNKEQDITSGSGRTSRLVIEGVTTGTPIEKQKGIKHQPVKPTARLASDEVINSAIKLVARLEQDRQETLDSLTKEKVRVQTLSETLDKECERRLNLLPTVVQAEHDECLRDILELKWHVNFDGRQLSRIKDDLRLITLENEKLKQAVDYYRENCPLLEEKLTFESGHMSEISQNQQETSDKLSQAKHTLAQVEDKSTKAHKRADKERENMENTLNECRLMLVMTENELKKAIAETDALTLQINDCQAKISGNHRQAKLLDDKIANSKGHLSSIEARVSVVRGNHTTVEANQLKLEQALQKLKDIKQTEHGNLEAEYVLLLAAMQKEDHTLRQARDCNDDMEHAIDTLKEGIAACNKQTHDDEKSVERARRELVKLDEQMGVSVAQFTKVREEHFHLSDQLKTDEAKAGDIEHSLRTKLEALRQQVKNEGRTKIMYDGKVQAGSAELDKLKAECKKQEEKAQKLSQESEKLSSGQTEVVAKLEENRDERSSLLASLQSELSSVEAEYAMVERELSERIATLTPQEKQLSETMQEKISRVDTVTERVKVLERKIEDLIKSTAMLDKMEVTTNATIEQLQSQLASVQEKLTAEKEEEQRCKQEYKDIADFSSNADEKHEKYLEKRAELLQQWKVDLHKAHTTNSKLATDYQKLQYEFISAKTLALRVLEKKLDKEASLRDHKQLLAFQSCIYSAMKAYYEHRGSKCWREVTHFHKESKHNTKQLRILQDQFKTVIELMHEFLEHGLS